MSCRGCRANKNPDYAGQPLASGSGGYFDESDQTEL